MSGDDLQRIAVEIWGERGWKVALANALGVDQVTVWRYLKSSAVPGPVKAAATCWLAAYRSSGVRPG